MSTANGMWYQSESKLKIPLSRACFVVIAQCPTTTAMTATMITRCHPLSLAGGGGAGVPRGAEDAERPSTVGDAAPTGPAGQSALAPPTRTAANTTNPG